MDPGSQSGEDSLRSYLFEGGGDKDDMATKLDIFGLVSAFTLVLHGKKALREEYIFKINEKVIFKQPKGTDMR